MAKSIQKFILSVVLLSVFFNVLIFSGCTEKPWYYDNVIWYSENPKIEIIKRPGKDWLGTLVTDDEEIQIELLWGPAGSFEIIDAKKDDGITPLEEMTLIKGKVKYDENSATLVIKKDYIFKYKYNSIVLQRKNID